jgi:HSP20 family protein
MTGLIARNSLFDDLFRDAPGFFVRPVQDDRLPAQIRVDVKETPVAYTLDAEVPGVAKDDIQITIEGNVVTLRAEIKQEETHRDGERVLRSERYRGAVSRAFQLPQDIDEAASKARYDNGVLHLTLAKKTAPSGQRLTIE